MNKKIITLALTILVAIAAVAAEENYSFDTGYQYKYGVSYRVFTDDEHNNSEVVLITDCEKSLMFIFRKNTAENDAKRMAEYDYKMFVRADSFGNIWTLFQNEAGTSYIVEKEDKYGNKSKTKPTNYIDEAIKYMENK